MSRTTQQIYDELMAEKATLSSLSALQPDIDTHQTLLQDLTSSSKVALWRIIYWLMAWALSLHEGIIEAFAASSETGTLRWYREQCLRFQYGNDLQYQDGRYVYAQEDPDAQIVKLAAAVEAPNGQLILKVANLVNGLPEPLTTDEKASFEYFILLTKFAGTATTVISQPADVLRVSYDVFYNPLVMNPDGSLISNPAVFPVKDAINAYIQNLPFNGILKVANLTDQVQAATGVANAVCLSAAARKHYEPSYTNILPLSGQMYNPEAGYLAISSTGGETLDDLINYIAA